MLLCCEACGEWCSSQHMLNIYRLNNYYLKTLIYVCFNCDVRESTFNGVLYFGPAIRPQLKYNSKINNFIKFYNVKHAIRKIYFKCIASKVYEYNIAILNHDVDEHLPIRKIYFII